jgi:hypothetical protein
VVDVLDPEQDSDTTAERATKRTVRIEISIWASQLAVTMGVVALPSSHHPVSVIPSRIHIATFFLK